MVLLAAFILLLFATFMSASFAAASSPPIIIQTKVKSVRQDHDASIIQQARRQLQSFSITDMLTLTNSTCRTDCPLCDCTYQNFTSEEEELQCTLNKSIEACSTNTFQSCYTDILNDTPFDIEGLCTVECSSVNGDGSAAVSPSTSDNRALCQICNIFSCCTNCPSEKAAECFPSNIEDGYTPAGWEPLSCTDSSGGVSLAFGSSWGCSALLLILFLSISYVTSFLLV